MSLKIETAVIAFAASSSWLTDGTCFAATQRGLLRTIDRGATWTPVLTSDAEIGPVPATAVAISPSFATDRTVLAAIPGGVGRSTDGGTTWKFVQLPLPAPVVTVLAMSPDFTHDCRAFAATMQDGVFRTEDGGKTWEAWNSGLFDLSVMNLVISPRDHAMYAGTSTGVFRSINAGRSWQPLSISPGLPAILSLAINAPVDGTFQVLAGTDCVGFWRSCDGGITWHELDPGAAGDAVHIIAQSTIPGQFLLLGDDSLAMSIDGGVSWCAIESLSVDIAEITAIAGPLSAPSLPMALVGTIDGGIQRVMLPRPVEGSR